MKNIRSIKRLMRLKAIIICLGLICGMTSFSPAVKAETKYDTLAYDKKLEKMEDIVEGEFKNSKIEETADGVELGLADGAAGEYVTPVVQAPFGATHIGLHWRENAPQENLVNVYVRTGDDEQNLGQWTPTVVEIDEGRDDRKNEEVFSALVGVEKDSFAQARVEFIPVEGVSPKIKDFTFTFINSGEESKQVTKKISWAPISTASSVGTLKTSPHGLNVNVISREEWGANESYRLKADGSEDWPRSYHGTRKIIVHHTAEASSNGVTDLEANKETVRATYYYHAITQRWGDIGYHALVDAAGNVYEGRYGTHDALTRTNPTADQIMTLDVEAGHAAGYNMGSFGVSAMGDFTNFDVPAAQLAGIKDVLAYVADSRGINVQGYSDYRNYDGLWHANLNNVIAHRDVNATACPGTKLYDRMTTMKTETDNLLDVYTSNLAGFSATVNGVSVSGKKIESGTIDFSWSSFAGATQYQYALERVFGTPGVASDSEPWQTAWLNSENANVAVTTGSSVQIPVGGLQDYSNYVFYVRALDANNQPVSTASHVNFETGDVAVVTPDTQAPMITIASPNNGATVKGTVVISTSATDNVGVTEMRLYIDGKRVLVKQASSLSYSWNTAVKQVSAGSHRILVEAYDAKKNKASMTVTVNVVK